MKITRARAVVHTLLIFPQVLPVTYAQWGRENRAGKRARRASIQPIYPSAEWPLGAYYVGYISGLPAERPRYEMRIKATNPLEPDNHWAHIHVRPPGSTVPDDQSTVTIQWQQFAGAPDYRQDVEVAYTVDGVRVSNFLSSDGSTSPPFAFNIQLDQFLPGQGPSNNPDALHVNSSFPEDGVFAISCEIRFKAGSALSQDDLFFAYPIPAYLHLERSNEAAGAPYGHFAIRQDSPLLNTGEEALYRSRFFGPIPDYVFPSNRSVQAHPIDPTLVHRVPPGTTFDPDQPLHSAPVQGGLTYFVDRMNPTSDLGNAYYLWWKHQGNFPSFARPISIEHVEHARSYLEFDNDSPTDHRKIPAIDGPRGTALITNFIGGQIDRAGNLYFAETSGRIGRLGPDGSVVTLVGHRVPPGQDPIWWQKSRDLVHNLSAGNAEFRGLWPGTQVPFGNPGNPRKHPGMQLPLDVAIDSDNPAVLYVAAYYDHCIYRVDIEDEDNAKVTVLAGDPTASTFDSEQRPVGGFQDGSGLSARFNGPASLVFDEFRQVLYVADQDNNSIRQVDRQGNVITILGGCCGSGPNYPAPLFDTMGHYYDSYNVRSVANFDTGTGINGTMPDIFLPQTVRLDSAGRLLVSEIGFGSIRRIVVEPTNSDYGTAELMADVYQQHSSSTRGWAWFDVDRYGAFGELDALYIGSFNPGNPKIPNTVEKEAWWWSPTNPPRPKKCCCGNNCNTCDCVNGNGKWVIPGQRIFQHSKDPRGLGLLSVTKGGHYPWLVAVDPRGAILTGGVGDFGIHRVRLAGADDIAEFPTNVLSSQYSDYLQGAQLVRQGGENIVFPPQWPFSKFRPSGQPRLGYGGNGMLGIANAWQYPAKDPAINASTRLSLLPSSMISGLPSNETSKVEHYLRWSAWDAVPPGGATSIPAVILAIIPDGNLDATVLVDNGEAGGTFNTTGWNSVTLFTIVPRATTGVQVSCSVFLPGGGAPIPLLHYQSLPFPSAANPYITPGEGWLAYQISDALPIDPVATLTADFEVTSSSTASIMGISGHIDSTNVTVTFAPL